MKFKQISTAQISTTELAIVMSLGPVGIVFRAWIRLKAGVCGEHTYFERDLHQKLSSISFFQRGENDSRGIPVQRRRRSYLKFLVFRALELTKLTLLAYFFLEVSKALSFESGF